MSPFSKDFAISTKVDLFAAVCCVIAGEQGGFTTKDCGLKVV